MLTEDDLAAPAARNAAKPDDVALISKALDALQAQAGMTPELAAARQALRQLDALARLKTGGERPLNGDGDTIAAMTYLRHLSVFVDEPDPGHFHWVLHESREDASVWVDVDSSVLSFPTWMEAFDAGCVELFKLVPDERSGPKATGEDENADPVD